MYVNTSTPLNSSHDICNEVIHDHGLLPYRFALFTTMWYIVLHNRL